MVHRHRRVAVVLIPLVVLLIGVAAGWTISSLQSRADSSRRAQIEIGSLRYTLQNLLNEAFAASPKAGGSPSKAAALIATDEKSMDDQVRQLVSASPPGALDAVPGELRAVYPVVHTIYEIGAYGGGYNGPRAAEVNLLQGKAYGETAQINGRLGLAANAYARRANLAKADALYGALATIVLLLVAFGFFYLRSVRARHAAEYLAAENTRLFEQSQRDALTDALTSLPNRRALARDLDRQFELASAQPTSATLFLFDLDGFKTYNDTFGHGAGDALLARLGARLATAVEGSGGAYRMGGDEFCVLMADAPASARSRTVSALTESGDGWHVGVSVGAVDIPGEGRNAEESLQLADARMYAQKAARKAGEDRLARNGASKASTRLAAQVEQLAARTAEVLGLSDDQLRTLRVAARMYNVGLRALPSSILDKPGPLAADEWAFVHRHPVVAERMIAADALADAATLVRSSNERADGRGYPDGLTAEEIPVGSRIIAVCGAYAAMTSPRSYAAVMSSEEAEAELAHQAGKQFDLAVVDAFIRSLHRPEEEPPCSCSGARACEIHTHAQVYADD